MQERSREAAEWEELDRQDLLWSLSEQERQRFGGLVQSHAGAPEQVCSSCGASDLWWYTATGWVCQCAADGRGRRVEADAMEARSDAPWPQRQPMHPVKQRKPAQEEESESSERLSDRKQQ